MAKPLEALEIKVSKNMNVIHNGFKRLSYVFWILICCVVILSGCEKEAPVETNQVVPKPVIQETQPANFIICIDNSASIRGQEQVIIRETTMLLADLAEQGDRISVVTFGERAKLAASSMIKNDQDRIAFKKQVSKRIDFKENYSDIRAGLRFLIENKYKTTHFKGFTSHIIILSDGKLEPKDKRTQAAFDEMRGVLKDLFNIDTYAVVLGDENCNDKIPVNVDDVKLDGKTLMKNFIATSSDHFFHARKMDQLFQAAVTILSKTKGISSIGDKAESSEFRIDNSVESMTFIVRKRSQNGTFLCNSSDILLNIPENTEERESESIYKSSDYQYFDLILVRNPREGMWSVSLANGDKANVLSKIVTPLELEFQSRRKYYLNESAIVSAWVFNKNSKEIVSDQNYNVKARLALHGEREKPSFYVNFRLDAENNQHFLEVPADIFSGMNSAAKPAKIKMELIAQRKKKNHTDMDPWFIRRSSPVSIDFVEAFVDWKLQESKIFKLPFMTEPIVFGAEGDPSVMNSIYAVLPTLKIKLEHFDNKLKTYKPLHETDEQKTINSSLKSDRIVFNQMFLLSELDSGMYRYSYQLEGTLSKGGNFSLKSPPYNFFVQSFSYDSWEFWACLGIMVLLLLHFLWALFAKVEGILETTAIPLNSRSYESELDYKNRFTLKAKRFFRIRTKIVLSVISGAVWVDDKRISEGEEIEISPGIPHTIKQEEDGEQIERKLMLTR